MHEIHQSHDHLISFVLNEGKIKKKKINNNQRGTCIHNQQNEWSMIHQNFLPPPKLEDRWSYLQDFWQNGPRKCEFSDRYYCNCITSWNVNSRAPGPPASCHFWTSKFEPPLIFCTTTNPHVAGDTTTTNFNIQLICYNCTGLKMAC